MPLKKVDIFTDGSCLGNPGPGGYAAIIFYKQHERILSEGFYLTTNNRMELLAAIKALETLKYSCLIDLYSDSQYVRKGITEWIKKWKLNGWRTTNKKPVKNADLWLRLDQQIVQHQITWHWVKGHAGHPINERCDLIAKEAASSPKQRDAEYESETALNANLVLSN